MGVLWLCALCDGVCGVCVSCVVVAHSHQVKRMIEGLERVVLHLETSNGQEHLVASCDPLAQVKTPRGPSHGKQN